jgi:hypothetical protein
MHKLYISGLLGIIMMTATISAEARPISYPGGVSAMVMNDAESNGANIQYSPTATYSIGYTFEHWRADNFNLHAMQVNNLLKRWNNPDSQGNLYLGSGVGVTEKNDAVHPVAFTGAEADWENRRFLVSYKNRYTTGPEINDFYMESARAGVAPYIGEFGDLHTWLMVQVDHYPQSHDPVTVTPLVRLFKGTNLVEAGVSNQGKILFNWMTQF